MILKRIDPLSAAKITGVIYALIGLVMGFFWGVFMMLITLFAKAAAPQANALGVLATVFIVLLAIIFFPILNGAFGFFFTLLAAWLYNLLAEKMGGVRVDFEAVVPVHAAPYTPPPVLPQEGL